MPKTKITPIFLFSLPRSGSTLLQRILASRPEIDTVSEPWFLLPIVYMSKTNGTYTEYWHQRSVQAVDDFVQCLPENRKTLFQSIRQMALFLYAQASGPGAIYFLDKTPRYNLIIDEIFTIFHDAKFIFLWRNPLSIISSLIDTWYGNKWLIHKYKIDLYKGFDNMMRAWQQYGSRSVSVNFESLVSQDSRQLQRLFSYLDLPSQNDTVDRFQEVALNGRMGDKTGASKYRSLSLEPVEKWKGSLSGVVRKKWCINYLRWIGEGRLQEIGYDLNDLSAQITAVPARWAGVVPDACRTFCGHFSNLIEAKIYFDKAGAIIKRNRLYRHR